jgi:hypothetical protein
MIALEEGMDMSIRMAGIELQKHSGACMFSSADLGRGNANIPRPCVSLQPQNICSHTYIQRRSRNHNLAHRLRISNFKLHLISLEGVAKTSRSVKYLFAEFRLPTNHPHCTMASSPFFKSPLLVHNSQLAIMNVWP